MKKFILLILVLCMGVFSLHAQINVNSTGVVRVGNQAALTSTFTPMSPNARLGVGGRLNMLNLGMQFIPMWEADPVTMTMTPVMALTGLSNQEASIGTSANKTKNLQIAILVKKYRLL
jgi:hypothetical protein